MSKLILTDILKRTSSWRTQNNHYIALFGHAPYSEVVTNEDLLQLDSRLPEVLAHWFSQREDRNGNPPLMSDRVIKLSLDLWRHPLTLRSIEDVDFQVGSIEEVNLLTPSEVQLRLVTYDVVNAGTIPYVQFATSEVIVMRPESLDVQFPGWQTRLNVHQSLDNDKSLLKAYVFNGDTETLIVPISILPDTLL